MSCRIISGDSEREMRIDTGLSNAVGFRFSENIGRLAENVVYIELKRRQTLNTELELFNFFIGRTSITGKLISSSRKGPRSHS